MPRYTKPTTSTDLHRVTHQLIVQNQDVTDDIECLIIYAEECIGGDLLSKDLSTFGFENVLLQADVDPTHPIYNYLGVAFVGNITYLGVLLHTDYGTPYFAMLYLDEQDRLRGYIPIEGNAINPLTKRPFGDGGTQDDQIAQYLGYADYSSIDDHLASVQASFYDISRLQNDITQNIQLRP